MHIDLSTLLSVFSVVALVIFIIILIQVSFMVVRLNRIIERVELMTDIKGWLSFFKRKRR